MTDTLASIGRSGRVLPPDADATAAARRRVRDRALLLWPRLDRRRLARTSGDPHRIARLVSLRTALSTESIVAMLTAGLDES